MGYLFTLAPMSAGMGAFTWLLGGLPVVLVVAAWMMPYKGVWLLIALCLLVWNGGIGLFWRPTAFVIRDDERLEIRFPVRRRWLELHPQRRVRQLSPAELQQEMGWVVGGWSGGFGRRWTQRRGWVELYLSRRDGVVLLEQPGSLPLLFTPTQPAQVVDRLSNREHPTAHESGKAA
ncbi:MAG: hypothetical protein Q6J33_04555 [Gloeomargarita sp. DG_2_bins_126]